jgi:hypothetical protein
MEIGIEVSKTKVYGKTFIRIAPFVRHDSPKMANNIKGLLIASVALTLLLAIGQAFAR